jgi:hypothetical protein
MVRSAAAPSAATVRERPAAHRQRPERKRDDRNHDDEQAFGGHLHLLFNGVAQPLPG